MNFGLNKNSTLAKLNYTFEPACQGLIKTRLFKLLFLSLILQLFTINVPAFNKIEWYESQKLLKIVSQIQIPELLPREQEIELALGAAPEHLRQEATVYIFGKNGYEKVRIGNNNFSCLVNRDGTQTGNKTLHPTCWDAEGSATILPVAMRVGELIAQGRTADEIKLDINAGYSDGRFHSPRKAGIAYMLGGDVQWDFVAGKILKQVFPPHYMIYAPGVTNADIGMNMEVYKNNASLPIIYSGYSGGSHTSYIIIPIGEGKPHLH